MAIAAGIECMWPSTNASIPAGWTRSTTMDSKYPKGTATAVDPDVTGGAATHTHTDPGHSHTVGSHTHSGPTSGADQGPRTDGFLTGSGYNSASPHTHTTPTSGAQTSTAASTAGVWQSGSNEPAYYQVIWIVSDGSPTGFPSLAWTFWDKVASLPTNWSNPAAARNVFPRGATAAGDGGGTGGGSHAHVANSHTHSIGSHAHTGSNTADDGTGALHTGYYTGADYSHVHATAFTSAGGTTAGTSSADSGTTSYEPTWAKLAVVQNDSGGQNVQGRMVAVWRGLLANIPSGWSLCDGTNSTVDMRGKFVKGADGIGEIGNTGGTEGHTHTDPATHTHTTGHTHSVSYDPTGSTAGRGDQGDAVAAASHAHNNATSGSDATASGGTIQSAPSNADTQPPFLTVAFIALTQETFTVAPAAVSLTLTGATPSIISGLFVAPAAVSLTLTGATPVLMGTVTPDAVTLTLTGASVALLVGVAPATVALILTGQSVTLMSGVAPASVALTLTGSTPALLVGVAPDSVALTLTGEVPVLLAGVAPAAATLILTGSTPVLLTVVAPAYVTLTLTGATPTVTVVGAGFATITITPEGASMRIVVV